MSIDQTTLYGFLGYQFHKAFNVYGGINTLGGSRSVMGSHPFWLANDRVMADEFFRPSFTGGAWVNGEVLPGLWYQVAAGEQPQSARHHRGSAQSWIGNGCDRCGGCPPRRNSVRMDRTATGNTTSALRRDSASRRRAAARTVSCRRIRLRRTLKSSSPTASTCSTPGRSRLA